MDNRQVCACPFRSQPHLTCSVPPLHELDITSLSFRVGGRNKESRLSHCHGEPHHQGTQVVNVKVITSGHEQAQRPLEHN